MVNIDVTEITVNHRYAFNDALAATKTPQFMQRKPHDSSSYSTISDCWFKFIANE